MQGTRVKWVVCFLVMIFAAGSAAWAQDDPADLMSGFEDLEVDYTAQEKGEETFYDRFDFSGWAKVFAAWDFGHDAPPPGQTDHRGLSNLRVEAFPQLEGRITDNWKVRINAKFWHDFIFDIKDDLAKTYENDMQNRAEVWEGYVQGNMGAVSLRVGRQIVVWGTSDDLRLTDVLNPLDARELGMTDIENLRLPVFMTSLDYVTGDWTLSGILINEVRVNMTPAYGSPYYPATVPPPPADVPVDSWDNQGYAASLTGRFTGWDMALYAANYVSHSSYYEMTRPPQFAFVWPVGPVMVAPPVIEQKYGRMTMFGGAAGVAVGNWLLKGEAAWFDGHRFFNLPGQTKSSVGGLFGLEYTGFDDTLLSVEASFDKILDWEEVLDTTPEDVRENNVYWAARASRDFMHDTLHLLAVATVAGADMDEGFFVRAQVEYDWTDWLSTTVGGVLYGTGEQEVFQYLDQNDRVFVEAQFNF